MIALAVSTAGRDSLLSAQRESMSWQVVKRGNPLTVLRRFDQMIRYSVKIPQDNQQVHEN